MQKQTLKNTTLFFIINCLLVFMFSCEEKTAEPDTIFATDYYPLEVGKYLIFEIDSVIFNSTIANDSGHWQIKEEIVDTFYDAQQTLNYRIERSKRKDDSSVWQLEYTWSAKNNNGTIEKTENNLTFIKLPSTLSLNKSWDGTAYLSDLSEIPVERTCDNLSFLEDWNYICTEISNNSALYEQTISITQSGADNLIEKDYAIETYAKGIGLIEKHFYHYYSQNLENIDWELKVSCGYKYSMILIAHN